MKNRMLIATLILIITGCATTNTKTPSKSWYNDDPSENFYRDRGYCISEARAGNRTNMPFDEIIFIGCMQNKGWYMK
jgi:hypothetical protein